jgi:hypothetical protein
VPKTTTEKGKKHSSGYNGQIYVEVILGPLKKFWQTAEKEISPGMLVVEDGALSHQSIVAKKAQLKLRLTYLISLIHQT